MKIFFFKRKDKIVENKIRNYILVWKFKDGWNEGILIFFKV